jgi:hypothetical protein
MQNEKGFIKFNNKLKSLQMYDTAQNYNTLHKSGSAFVTT